MKRKSTFPERLNCYETRTTLTKRRSKSKQVVSSVVPSVAPTPVIAPTQDVLPPIAPVAQSPIITAPQPTTGIIIPSPIPVIDQSPVDTSNIVPTTPSPINAPAAPVVPCPRREIIWVDADDKRIIPDQSLEVVVFGLPVSQTPMVHHLKKVELSYYSCPNIYSPQYPVQLHPARALAESSISTNHIHNVDESNMDDRQFNSVAVTVPSIKCNQSKDPHRLMSTSMNIVKNTNIGNEVRITTEDLVLQHKRLMLDQFLFLAENRINDRLGVRGGKCVKNLDIGTVEFGVLVAHFNKHQTGNIGYQDVQTPTTKFDFSRYKSNSNMNEELFKLPPLYTDGWHQNVFARTSVSSKDIINSKIDCVSFVYNHYTWMVTCNFKYRNWKCDAACVRGAEPPKKTLVVDHLTG
ncbi:hypothetical protein PPL_05442 [Heterostelium album PN500]|uniref:Uncharacterized protein n=1 Tax=Heterostelium pallidum (strain ATCC 26659 / Pp 5 / PN500) TaxID=670386 RepID=D3BA67_HETP5|nr:hypothetical protein PPL_06928 [Heterostelium album PN500]XP_020433572.1 hypothetical protein PPL_05442 [Heterostelium album PN500]EFA80106.1 hypothetical protein PPL_06928 [Heterostelium album PN500]EFA81454.1 hypothetical protein PPL_05442 [Heterostelium album PN500]|eukprot:XP_020432226.1 hypothetical protein PPL_06928 [Heterostelium album PN500]